MDPGAVTDSSVEEDGEERQDGGECGRQQQVGVGRVGEQGGEERREGGQQCRQDCHSHRPRGQGCHRGGAGGAGDEGVQGAGDVVAGGGRDCSLG